MTIDYNPLVKMPLRRLNDTHHLTRSLRLGTHNEYRKSWDRLEIRLRDGVATFIQNYSTLRDESRPVSGDTLTLIVLFIGKVVPAGVLADRLDEDHPDLSWVSEFLRRWDNAEDAV